MVESIMTVKVIVKQGEDGYFVASCPSLKSCWSQAKDRQEARKNIREAIALYLEISYSGTVKAPIPSGESTTSILPSGSRSRVGA